VNAIFLALSLVSGQGTPSDGIPETITVPQIMSVINDNKPAVVECLNQQKARSPEATGTVTMQWKIFPAGGTDEVVAVQGGKEAPWLAECLAKTIRTWKFPAHKKQTSPAKFPFKY
jgi:hypothetical protein